jgi:hypothetical protein
MGSFRQTPMATIYPPAPVGNITQSENLLTTNLTHANLAKTKLVLNK